MMASEAQRLIGISLTKIAQSRSHRGGVSLHKNLLVATVLQKARYIFMEEAYNMVHYQPPAPPAPISPTPSPAATSTNEEEELIGLTAEEAGLEPIQHENESSGDLLDFSFQSCLKCDSEPNGNKENQPPSYNNNNSELTYLDLDNKTSSSVLRESSRRCHSVGVKRRRSATGITLATSEWETEEAVQSILPKRSRSSQDAVGDDDVFEDSATLLSNAVAQELSETSGNNGMEIDRITSLVSIFSFTMSDAGKNEGAGSAAAKSSRSMSTPDLCSSQAKDLSDTIQRPSYLAMTV